MSTPQKIYALLTPPERKRVFALLALMAAGAVLETFGISLVIPAIGLMTQPDAGAADSRVARVLALLGHPSQVQTVAAGMLALVAIYLVKTVFGIFLVWRQAAFTFGLETRLSERLFSIYLRQPYTFHLQRNSAQLIRNLVTEIREFTTTAMAPGMLLLTESLVMCGIAILLLAIQPIGTLAIALILGTAVAAFHGATRNRVARWGEIRQHHDGLRIQHLQQGLGAAKDVIVLGREDEFIGQHRAHNVASAGAARRHNTLLEMPRLALEFLAVLALTILVFAMIAQGRAIATILPTLGLFAAAAFRLMPSANRILNAMHLLRYGKAVVDNLASELALPSAPASVGGAAGDPFRQGMVVSGVSYTYPGAAAPALADVSLSMNRGESIGLIGSSGAGKSTAVDVILGLLKPDSGRVLVDGQDIQANLRGWQNQIGYVPQSIYLTDDTVRRNVAFGVAEGDIDDAAVRRAIAAAQLEEFVAGRPEGLQAVLGERGVRLSGGQRQRLGIARALYHDPPVLILDEATSALDTATERDVMEAVVALHGSKTILVVAHRLSTVMHCDRLYRLDRGQVVEQGAAAEMLTPSASQGRP